MAHAGRYYVTFTQRHYSIPGSTAPFPETLMSALVEQLQQEAGLEAGAAVFAEDDAVVLLRHRFDASEGEMGHPRQLRLGLALAGGGRLSQHTDLASLQAQWQPGQFNLVLPGDRGRYASPAIELLGLAIDTNRLAQHPNHLTALQPLAAGLHRDPLITAVLQTLWLSTQADACLPGFLQHGAQVILHRLSQLAGQSPAARSSSSLSARRLQRLDAFIDEQRGNTLDVALLARSVEMDVSSFSRALQAATGMPPYAYLTRRRMAWAQRSLSEGRTVTEVAMASGYANPSKFSAAFRRVVGCPPSMWRRQQHR